MPSFGSKRVTGLSEVRQHKGLGTLRHGAENAPRRPRCPPKRFERRETLMSSHVNYLLSQVGLTVRSHEARVLVVEEVGKQLAIRRIVIMRAGAFERRRSTSHDLAGRKPIAIADATIGGDKANRCVRFEGLPSRWSWKAEPREVHPSVGDRC